VWSNAIELLPIDASHLDVLRHLPFHHKDPFDRLIIAQSMVEKMTIITVDRWFAAYDVDIQWDTP
jgi:PIN domain nuclease of toxin-antitoxin system